MNTCKTCKHAVMRPENREVYKRGFRSCTYMPIYQFVSGISSCRFTPAKWEIKA
jgi:hypothetical protein